MVQRHYRLLDTAVIIVLSAALIGPLFRITYLDNWPSIESTFIADARMLAANMPHPGWQPLWYCGTRFDYVYPPALRYGTALISLLAHLSSARAYHIYIGLLYILGLVSVYWLVLVGSRSRTSAWLSATAVALVSPSLILVRALRDDSPWLVPQRLHVLMSYGEGPHISALCVLPAALAAAFIALRHWKPAAFALAGVLCAFTVANNFYGATALAILFPILVWSVWIGLRDRFVWLRAAGIATHAYGLSAFWLTPSYLRITWINLKWVSSPGNTHSRLIMLAFIVVFCIASYRWASRRSDRIWPVFVMGSALILAVDVLGHFYFGLRVLGEAHRLAPELDLALVLLLVLIVNACWNLPASRWGKVPALASALLTVVMFLPATRYLRHAYSPFVRADNWQDQYERRIAKWVHENLPGQRVFPTGTNRFWFDAWFDNAQPDGGSDQALLNQVLPAARYQLTQNERGDVSVLWLQALGTSAVIVTDQRSYEHYHDYRVPRKFEGLLPVLFDDQHGTVIYRVPRIFPSLGRVVDRVKQSSIGEVRSGDDLETLSRYVSLIEARGQQETRAAWSDFDTLRIDASVADGQTVLLQETYDPAWHAYEKGKPLRIRMDRVMGFMAIDLPAGVHAINLRFETPLENRVGQVSLAISLVIVFALLFGKSFRRWSFGAIIVCGVTP